MYGVWPTYLAGLRSSLDQSPNSKNVRQTRAEMHGACCHRLVLFRPLTKYRTGPRATPTGFGGCFSHTNLYGRALLQYTRAYIWNTSFAVVSDVQPHRQPQGFFCTTTDSRKERLLACQIFRRFCAPETRHLADYLLSLALTSLSVQISGSKLRTNTTNGSQKRKSHWGLPLACRCLATRNDVTVGG